MNIAMDHLKSSLIQFCTRIGKDPLLVQGAGGNISWKDRNTLWIKASGTCINDAATKDIFVPIDLPQLRQTINCSKFSFRPTVSNQSNLRPSIETLLHALMPHRIVLHLHAIEILAHLVQENCKYYLQTLLRDTLTWEIVDYHQPGAALAAAVNQALTGKSDIDVIFLLNHGVVIGGDDITQIEQRLTGLTSQLKLKPVYRTDSTSSLPLPSEPSRLNYQPVPDKNVHQLALNPKLFTRLKSNWALCPDHVVFLGPKAHTYPSWKALENSNIPSNQLPELVFIQGMGVFTNQQFSLAKQCQLRAYFDLLVRLEPDHLIHTLTDNQVLELIHWDAEKYRLTRASHDSSKVIS